MFEVIQPCECFTNKKSLLERSSDRGPMTVFFASVVLPYEKPVYWPEASINIVCQKKKHYQAGHNMPLYTECNT